jgi:hypothetical protein
MSAFFQRKSVFLALLILLAGFSATIVYFAFNLSSFSASRQSMFSTHLQLASTGTAIKTLSSPTPTTAPVYCDAKNKNFEMGIAFPGWDTNSYGSNDSNWIAALPKMQSQTSSCWVELPLLFSQDTMSSTIVKLGTATPSVAAFSYGVQYAHSMGLHVFVAPLLTVTATSSNHWAGSITFSTSSAEQVWFTSYFQTLTPYLQASAQYNVEQFSIGTEESWLQVHAPANLWNTLLTNIRNIYAGALTYDTNWTDLTGSLPSWWQNSALSMIGVSAYMPQITTSKKLTRQQILEIWSSISQPELDTFAKNLGKPIFVSEIGYRNASDPLYQPWSTTTTGAADPAAQADAIDAALTILSADTNIHGVFFWAWTGSDSMNLSGTPAVSVIKQHYQALQLGN